MHPHEPEKRLSAGDLCPFCGTSVQITKEHVLPRWTFANCDRKFFISAVNGLNQTYNRTTIPACNTCNNELLSSIENYINEVLYRYDNRLGLALEDLENLIRWLEIIDYKFQVLEVKRTFKASKTGGFIPFLANYPMAVMHDKVNYSPYKAIAQLRRIRNQLTRKSKSHKLNSLVLFKMKEPIGFYYFHNPEEFIFLQMPQYNTAVFYFYEREFKTERQAANAAMNIIKMVQEDNQEEGA